KRGVLPSLAGASGFVLAPPLPLVGEGGWGVRGDAGASQPCCERGAVRSRTKSPDCSPPVVATASEGGFVREESLRPLDRGAIIIGGIVSSIREPVMATPDECVDDVFQPGGRLRLELLTQSALDALKESLRLARETRWDSLRSPHVFM